MNSLIESLLAAGMEVSRTMIDLELGDLILSFIDEIMI